MSPAPYVFDQGVESTVTVCRVCGWRTLTGTRAEALTAADAHHRRAHPNEQRGWMQLYALRRRGQR